MMYALRALVAMAGYKDFPTYSSYVESLKKPKVVDRRSSDDIYNDLLAGLRGEKR